MDVDKKFLEALGARITKRRKEVGLKQTDLAERLGCSQSLVAAYEAGDRRLPVPFLPQLAELLDISVNELLGLPERQSKRTKRGPPSLLQQRIEEVQKLPRSKQQAVLQMIDGVLRAESR